VKAPEFTGNSVEYICYPRPIQQKCWAIFPRPATICRLGELLPRQLADRSIVYSTFPCHLWVFPIQQQEVTKFYLADLLLWTC